MSFKGVDEVAKWAEKNGGVDAIRQAHAALVFGDGQRVVACIEEWLRLQDNEKQRAIDEHNNALRLREINAAEDSADSAKKAAIAAEKSARWATWAVVLSVVAMIASIFK